MDGPRILENDVDVRVTEAGDRRITEQFVATEAASLAASGVLAAFGGILHDVSLSLSAVGAIATNPSVVLLITTGGNASLVATPTVISQMALVASGSLSAAWGSFQDGAASFAASGVIGSAATRVAPGAAALSGVASMTLRPTVVVSNSLVAQGSVVPRPTISVLLSLLSQGSVTTLPRLIQEAITLRSGISSLTANGGGAVQGGNVNAIVVSTLTGNGQMLHNAVVSQQESRRITEANDPRITEAGDVRITSDPGVMGGILQASATTIPFTAGFFAKKNGLWQAVTPSVRFNGAWRTPAVYVRRNGNWLRVF